MSGKERTGAEYPIGALLRKPYDALIREVYGSIAHDGHPTLNPSNGRILRHVSSSGIRTIDLARLVGMTKQSMAQLITGLEANGYVSLAPHPSDGRAKLVTLTAKGQQVQTAIITRTADIERQWAQQLGEARWQDAKETLRTLFDLLD